jgi:hypothetical protein
MRALKRLIAILMVSTGLIAVAAVPAMADADDCPDEYVCMWEDNWYHGSMYVKYKQNSKSGNKVDIGGWNGDNEISAVVNNTVYTVVLYDNDNWTGTHICVLWFKSSYNLAVDYGFDNEAESFRLVDSPVGYC